MIPKNDIQKNRLNRHSAFTLIELLVVMFIIGLLTSVVLANYRSGQEQYILEQAAQKLVSDIRKAQNMAISGVEITGVCDEDNSCDGYGLYANMNNNFYIIYADKNSNFTFQPGPDAAIETINLPDKTEIQDVLPLPPKAHIFFKPPAPTTFINGKDDVGESGAIILGIEDTSLTKTIIVTTAGLIYSN